MSGASNIITEHRASVAVGRFEDAIFASHVLHIPSALDLI